MAREFSVVVGINATKAIAGGRQFKAGATQVNRSNRAMQVSTARTTKRVTALITTMGRFRGVASLMFAGFLGVGGISAVIRTLATFQKSMSNVKALLGDRGVGGAMTSLTSKARELGATTAFTASQAAEGMKFLTLAGFDALQTFQAIGPALDLAQAGALGLGEAADIVSNIMQGFNINANRTAEVVDALAFVASRSNTNIQQLGQAMKFVAPVAGALNLSVQEVSAALGLLGNSGLQASLAGTGLRRVLSGLLNPSKEANKVLGQMGLSADDLVVALQDPQKGLTFVIKELEDAGLGAAEAFTLFGQRGAPALLSLLGQTGKLEAFNKQMESIEGTARKIGQVMIDNLAGDARIAISSVQEAILRLGEAGLTEWLQDTTKAFTAFVRGLSDVDQQLEGSTAKIRKWAAAGTFLRDNVDKLQLGFSLLVAFMNRVLLVSIAGGIAAFAKFSLVLLGLVRTFGIMGAAGILLATKMTLLRAAIISTGVGALVVAAGFLLDWILFSKDAETQNDKTTAAFNRQKSEIEDLAFQFNILTQAEKALAVGKLQSFLLDQELALKKMERQMINSASATTKLAQGNAALEVAQERVNKVLKFNSTLQSESFKVGSESHAALLAREEATLNIAEANLLLASTEGVSLVKLAEMRQSVADLTLRLEAQRSVFAGIDATVEDYIARINGATDAVDEFVQKLKGQTGLNDTQLISLKKLVEEYSKTETKITELTGSVELFELAGKKAVIIETAMGVEAGTLARVQGLLNLKLLDTKNKLNAVEKAAKTWKERLEDLRDGSDKLAKLQRQLARDTNEVILEWIRGGRQAGQLAEALKLLNDEYKKNKKELDEVCEKNKKVRECTEDSVKRMEEVWKQGLRNIQDSFADAFKNMLDGSGNTFDGILDAFKDMISNMLAAWAISGIANLFSGASFGANGNSIGNIFSVGSSLLSGGGSSSTGTGSGVGGIGSLLSGGGPVSSAITALTAGVAAFGQGALAFLTGASTAPAIAIGGIGSTGIAGGFGASTGANVAAATNPGSFAAGGVAAGAGIGALTGAVVDAILGGRGDQATTLSLAAIGGAIGSVFPGLGTIIGGAIGALVGNIFGGAKKLESATLSLGVASDQFFGETETIVSKQRSFFRGRSFTTTVTNISNSLSTMETLFSDFATGLISQAESLGGTTDFLETFTFDRELNIAGKTKEQVQALVTSFLEDAMLSAVQEFIRDVEGLSDRVQLTLESFSGNVEAFVTAFELLGAIENLFDIDLVQSTTDAIENSQVGILDAYQMALGGFREVIAGYDGSLESLEQLTQATAIFTQLQLDLVSVYQLLGTEISAMFQGSAQTIRESLLSEEELFNLRKSQIDELVAQAAVTTDPEDLSILANEINRLGLENFNSLDADQQALLGPEFIEFFDGLDALFGDQIAEGIGNVVQDQADLDLAVATRMEEAAQAIIDAQNAARELYEQWRDDMEFRSEIHR